MTPVEEANKGVLERYRQAYNSRDRGGIRAVYADPLVYGGTEVSVDGVLGAAEMWWTAFPNITLEFEHVIAEDELVATRERFRGTHEEEYRGIEPTGVEMDLTYMVLYRVKAGAIVRTWSHFDTHGFNEQLDDTASTLAASIADHLGG